jgi:hypothetical protein
VRYKLPAPNPFGVRRQTVKPGASQTVANGENDDFVILESFSMKLTENDDMIVTKFL